MLGLLIALALPVANLIVANLWDRRIVIFDPDGAVIGVLQGTFLLELFLGPLGLFVAGSSAGVRGFVQWSALLLMTVPPLALLWFLGVASVGLLAGEPF